MTDAARRAALEAIAAEVRSCTRCRLHEGRTSAVPGEGHPATEVVFVGEGPGFNEDRLGRPFVGRAGDFLVRLLRSIGWQREDVFITNIVKCRPPDNRDPEPDEVAACAPFLRRQLEALDPSLLVTLGRHSMARFMPGTSISRAHGTLAPVDPATGAANALVFALYHPAAALRSPDVAEASFADMARLPVALEEARRRREGGPDPADAPAQPDGEAAALGLASAPALTTSAVPADASPPALGSSPAAPAAAASLAATPAPAPTESLPIAATPPDPAAAPAAVPAPAPAEDDAPAAVNQLTLFG